MYIHCIDNCICLNAIPSTGEHSQGHGLQSASSQDGQCCILYICKGLICDRLCTICIYTVYSHGEALTFEPLLLENREESPLRDHSIVALATVTQVLQALKLWDSL